MNRDVHHCYHPPGAGQGDGLGKDVGPAPRPAPTCACGRAINHAGMCRERYREQHPQADKPVGLPVMTLARAIAQFSRNRVGTQKDLSRRLGVSETYVGKLMVGARPMKAPQLNRILDACGASDDERAQFNRWGAREAGWKI